MRTYEWGADPEVEEPLHRAKPLIGSKVPGPFLRGRGRRSARHVGDLYVDGTPAQIEHVPPSSPTAAPAKRGRGPACSPFHETRAVASVSPSPKTRWPKDLSRNLPLHELLAHIRVRQAKVRLDSYFGGVVDSEGQHGRSVAAA